MMRFLVLILCVASLTLGSPLEKGRYNKNDLLKLSQEAIMEGVERILKAAQDEVGSEFDDLEYNIKSKGYKSKTIIKGNKYSLLTR